MWTDDIANYARTGTFDGLPSDEIYANTIPSDRKIGAMLTAGYKGMSVDPEIPAYHKGPMQLIVRAGESLDAEAIAQLVSDYLMLCQEVTVGDIFIHYINPRHLPVVFPASNGDHYEASVNFDVCFVRLLA